MSRKRGLYSHASVLCLPTPLLRTFLHRSQVRCCPGRNTNTDHLSLPNNAPDHVKSNALSLLPRPLDADLCSRGHCGRCRASLRARWRCRHGDAATVAQYSLLCFFDQRCAWCGTAYEAGAATTLQRHGEMTLREFAVRPFDTQVFKADRRSAFIPESSDSERSLRAQLQERTQRARHLHKRGDANAKPRTTSGENVPGS